MVLAGLFGMPGLGPAPLPESHRTASATHAVSDAAHEAPPGGRHLAPAGHDGRAVAAGVDGHRQADHHGQPGHPAQSAHHPSSGEHSGQQSREHSDAEGHGGSDCAGHGEGGCHLSHADATCAASGISGGPVIALPAVCSPVDDRAEAAAGEAERAAPGVRAPPSLHQLQLLRI